MRGRSSRDSWKTVVEGTADISAPGAVSLVSDEGREIDAVLLHHGGIIDRETGDLYLSGFGSFADDELAGRATRTFRVGVSLVACSLGPSTMG